MLTPQFLRQNGQLLLGIEAGIGLLLIDTCSSAANKAYTTCLTGTTLVRVLSIAAWIASAKSGSGLQTEAAVVEASALQQRGALVAISRQKSWMIRLSAII
jgi:hypothetical protein